MIDNENSTNMSADSLQASQIQIVWWFLSGPRDRQWDHVLLLISKPSNRLRALKAHRSLFKCCAKNCPNYMYWMQGKHRGSWVLVFLRLSVSLKLIFIVPLNFLFYFYIFFLIRGGGCHWQGRASGPKNHIGRSKSDICRAEKSHKGQNVTLECYNVLHCIALHCIAFAFALHLHCIALHCMLS